MNHHTQIIRCEQDFHMQKIDHHTLIHTYLDIFRSWQKNKNYNTELDIKKETTNAFHNCHANRNTINSCHVK